MLDVVSIFAVALLGGLLPLAVRWNDRRLHLALSLSTGIFLGAVFLHLLPALPSGVEEHGPGDGHGHAHHGGNQLVWLCVLLGVVAIYLVEALFLRTHDHDDLHRHRAVGWAALWGLGVHALTAGMAYALAVQDGGDLAGAMLLAILAHKGFESFSLTTVFLLAEAGRTRVVVLSVLFGLVTPLGILVGGGLFDALGDQARDVLMALAAGTFLYVCLCELLSEVFHHREDGLAKLGLLALGVAGMALTHQLGGV